MATKTSTALTTFPFPPLFQPIADLKNGITTPHWVTYFTDLSNRVRTATIALGDLPAEPGVPTVPDTPEPPPLPPITSLLFANRGLRVRDQGPNNALTLQPIGTYTTGRTLGFKLNNADRTINFLGDTTLDDWFDQCVKTVCSPTFANMLLTGTLNTFGLFVNGFPVVVTGPTHLDNWFDQCVKTTCSPTFANLTVPGSVVINGSLTVNGVPITGSGTLPPNIAFTNVNNNFSIVQSFQAGAVLNTNQLYVNGFQISTLGNTVLNQNVATSGTPTFANVYVPGFVRVVGSNAATIIGVQIGSSTNTTGPAWPFEGLYVHAPTGALVTARETSTGHQIGFFAHNSGAYFGTWTPTQLNIRTNNLDRMVFNLAGDRIDCAGQSIYPLTLDASSAVVSRDFVWAEQRLYVQGHRVTVTADCTIPSTGGGGSGLPPTLAYFDTSNPWSIQQNFQGVTATALNVAGVQININQDLLTSSSPTFQNMQVNSALTVLGNVSSPRYDSGGKTGITRSGIQGGLLMEVTGGIITFWGPP